MGVSISIGKKDITPGWRSMMYQLLLDNFGYIQTGYSVEFILMDYDVPTLKHIKKHQYKDIKEKPFDYATDIEQSFDEIIKIIEKKGEARITCRH